ncbi:hypothetical protein KAX17_10015 [Candidatus Bipolaricaulota bacterium]|nr:hypothetical protein [Candidatus Bipolaricaulota bacterium]
MSLLLNLYADILQCSDWYLFRILNVAFTRPYPSSISYHKDCFDITGYPTGFYRITRSRLEINPRWPWLQARWGDYSSSIWRYIKVTFPEVGMGFWP